MTATTSRASIYGGRHTAGNLADVTRLTAQLALLARSLRSCAQSWENTGHLAENEYGTLRNCPVLVQNPTDVSTSAHSPTLRHNISAVAPGSTELAVQFSTLSTRYSDLSDLVARAHSLYSAADNTVSKLVTAALGKLGADNPLGAFLGAGLLVGSAVAAGGGSELGGNIMNVSEPLQEGIFRGLGSFLSGRWGLLGGTSAHPVNDAAHHIASITSFLSTLFFGNKLVVTEPQPAIDPIGASASIGDALANLDALRDSPHALDYGTVAVQKYVDDDGHTRWLVLIPGTDTHADTAIGWGQNIELMSSDNTQRMNADSAKLVVEAMERSGVKPDEPVSLVGHSQGGIIAATLAAGLGKRYTIAHVVTAGSPIANHPIPESTWVTSVENAGEGVSNIDGARNPQRPTWLTVRGTITSADAAAREKGSSGTNGTVVEGAPSHTDITHAMNYQRATWKDAQQLGSEALNEHDEHFAEQIKGRLESSQYYTGRMTR
ncbi:MAG: alpha/beta hydrolase [Bifidobacteriaceae bacterium]|nr:alpha/beta hydrolase [Bifidobacteriaceae bacterium]MCI1978841.1 alpha/beta hydrolase [Bifidobacteriaceae bacterium]